MLLANGADPNTRNNAGWTALIVATRERNMAIIEKLLANGADPNIRTKVGATALAWAAESGRVRLVDLFLTNGADPYVEDQKGRTALSRAILNDHNAVVNSLLHAHAEHFNHYSDIPRALVASRAIYWRTQNRSRQLTKRKRKRKGRS